MNRNELRITMLGKFELGWGDGRSHKPFTAKVATKNRALLCYLVLNHRLHQREELARIFWPDNLDGKPNLRVALNALRNAGLTSYLDTLRPEITFIQQEAYWCDAQIFETLITKSRHQNKPDIPALRKAVALYQGRFLEGFALPELPLFDEWMNSLRLRYEDMMWQALDTIIRWAMKDSAYYEVGVEYAKRALELAPWRETAHQHLMWLLASSGQRDVALTQYERCREALKTLLDVDEPSPTTKELYVNIRQMKSATKPQTVPLPPLHTTLPEDEPPFLAPPLPSLIVGRLASAAELAEALTAVSGLPRLGIVGMGGIGKTTLAIHLAHTLRDHFPDGVLWANVVDEQPEEIATQWAAAYGYDLSQQNSGEERLAVVSRLLATKRALLILDDVWTGSKIRPLLPESGRCAVLITSRAERIVRSVDAEPVLLDKLSPEDGRSLLLSYIDEGRVQDNPAAIAEICELVDQLPLAISIAGSYLAYRPHRTLADFLLQLKKQIKPLDLAEDAQRIRETFELSWRYLEGNQSRLFALLGLFEGHGFSLEAIAEIAQFPRDDIYWIEDRLQELVQLSLLQAEGNHRYRQHGLLANFAQDKLGDDGSAREQFVAYFSAFAETHAAKYALLRPEWANLDTAVRLAEANQQWMAVLRLTAALKDAWFARGRFKQARQAFEIAFQAAIRLEDEPLLARNWLWWGQACLEQGDQAEARKWLQQALDLYDELEDGIGIADAEFELARLDIEQTLPQEAERRLNRVLALRQAQADEKGTAAALYRKARLRHRQQAEENAHELALESVARQQAIGDDLGRCRTLRLLVYIMIGLKQNELALQFAEESLALAEALDDLGEIAMAKKGLASSYHMLNRLEEASQLALESYATLERMADRQSMTAVRFLQCLIKRAEGKFNEAMSLAEECLVEFSHLKDDLHVAFCLTHQGDFHKQWGDMETAVQKWRAALAIAQKMGNDKVAEKINGRIPSQT
ncbi:MAG: tetratricopeptide repeat protein [Ardenticatenaceae bacterium]|nr:tetratricopeptide repeat protein [Ardenticatenaceae bacterium]